MPSFHISVKDKQKNYEYICCQMNANVLHYSQVSFGNKNFEWKVRNMRKICVIFLVLAMCLMLWACTEQPQGSSTAPSNSQPSESQPNVIDPGGQEAKFDKPLKRPVYMGELEPVGWYEFEYAEGCNYPTKVHMTDLEGNLLGYYGLELDEKGMPTKLIAYNPDGSKQADDAFFLLECNEKGYVIKASANVEGETISFEMTYNEEGRIIATNMNMYGMEMLMEYDEQYRVIRASAEQDGQSLVAELGYGADGEIIKMLQLVDGICIEGFEKEFDENGTLHKETTYENGCLAKEVTYDENGKPVRFYGCYQSVDGTETYVTECQYDEKDRIAEERNYRDDVFCGKTVWTYEETGNFWKISYDAEGVVSHKRYAEVDSEGRTVKESQYESDDTLLFYTEWAYDAEGNEIKELNYSAQNELTNGYELILDADGNVQKEIEYDYGGLRRETEYDTQGNRIKFVVIRADGSCSVIENDSSGGVITNMEYNAEGAPIEGFRSVCDEKGNVILREWYRDGVLDDKKGYEYHANGQIYKKVCYSADEKVNWVNEYDLNGNLVKNEDYFYREDGTLSSLWVYDGAGKAILEKHFDVGGNVITHSEYAYYENGELKTISNYEKGAFAGKTEFEYQYDENGRKVKEIECHYDKDGALESKAESELDENGLAVVVLFYEDGKLIQKNEIEYYADGTRKKDTAHSCRTGTWKLAYVLEYYSSGADKSETFYDENGNVTYHREYDENGNVVK